jgi:hypothetical protein
MPGVEAKLTAPQVVSMIRAPKYSRALISLSPRSERNGDGEGRCV